MKLGHALATASWASVFTLIWLMIAKIAEFTVGNVAFLIFFFILAVSVTAVIASDKGGNEKGSNGRHA